MITNEQFLQYNAMLHKICNKYKNNTYGMEFDDLFQVGSLGIMRAYETYKEGEGVTFDNYVYRCITWAIMNELRRYKRIKQQYNFNYLDSCIDTEEEGTLHDIIADESINVSCAALDNVTIQDYIKEFKLILTPFRCDIMIDRYIHNLDVKTIAEKYDKTEGVIRSNIRESKNLLIRKSFMIRQEYERYQREKEKKINKYMDPGKVVSLDQQFKEIYAELEKLKIQQIKADTEIIKKYMI